MNSHDLSILSLVTNASLLVQVVMLLLLLISLTSWTIIFRKWFTIRAAQSATNDASPLLVLGHRGRGERGADVAGGNSRDVDERNAIHVCALQYEFCRTPI